jgi:expansin (peptidoglycan-binding protein)
MVSMLATLVAACSSDDDGGSSPAGTGGGGSSNGGSSNGGSSTGGSSSSNPPVSLGEERSGEATYYDFADGSGACMFDPSPEDMNVAALNSEDWAGSAWCGACADVDGPNGSVRIRIVDLCPECPTGHLDLSPQAFEQIAELSAGRVPITWSFVSCDVSGPISYRYKDGANEWWTAVQVLNHRLPITSLEWSPDGTGWNPTQREDYNYFLDAGGFGPDPVRVRITAIDGQTLEDDLPAVQEYLVVEGQRNFD